MKNFYFDDVFDSIKNIKFLTIWLRNDKDEKIVLEKNLLDETLANIFINSNLYKKEKDKINSFIKKIITSDNLCSVSFVNGSLVTDELIAAVINNKNVKTFRIGTFKKDKYNLAFNTYLKLMLSDLTLVEACSEDPKIKILDNYDDEFGIVSFNACEFIINKKTTKEEINKLIVKENDADIIFIQSGLIYLNEVISKINEKEMDNKVFIEISNKKEFNKNFISKTLDYNNIFFRVHGEELTVLEYLKYEKLLYSMIESAQELSPFEKYIYAYNITKMFKKYKGTDEDTYISRNLYKILDSDYIVCAGYANLFSDLLDKLGIENCYLSEAVGKEENGELKKGWHARVYSNIIDPKYGINGFYRADPTWDSSFNEDYYTHLIFTDNQATHSKSKLWLDLETINELFNINSIEEFYEKINFYINKVDISTKEIVIELLDKLTNLDKEFTQNIKIKYNIINDNTEFNVLALLEELGNYILSKVNKKISLETIMEAVSVIYKHFYGYKEEDVDYIIEFINTINEERYYEFFEDEKNK